MRSGATPEKLEAIARFRESPLFDERERAALEMAEAMTITGREVDDALFARVREHFSEAAAVELAAAIALENFRSKLNRALRIEAQGFCAWRPEAPAGAPAVGASPAGASPADAPPAGASPAGGPTPASTP